MKNFIIGFFAGIFYLVAVLFIFPPPPPKIDYEIELTNDNGDFKLHDGKRLVGVGNVFDNPCIDSLIKADNQ